MVLVGTLASYPSITYVKQFTVIVDDCEATISTAGVTIPTLSNTWYFSPATYSFNTTQLENMVVQTPNCQYSLRLETFYL